MSIVNTTNEIVKLLEATFPEHSTKLRSEVELRRLIGSSELEILEWLRGAVDKNTQTLAGYLEASTLQNQVEQLVLERQVVHSRAAGPALRPKRQFSLKEAHRPNSEEKSDANSPSQSSTPPSPRPQPNQGAVVLDFVGKLIKNSVEQCKPQSSIDLCPDAVAQESLRQVSASKIPPEITKETLNSFNQSVADINSELRFKINVPVKRQINAPNTHSKRRPAQRHKPFRKIEKSNASRVIHDWASPNSSSAVGRLNPTGLNFTHAGFLFVLLSAATWLTHSLAQAIGGGIWDYTIAVALEYSIVLLVQAKSDNKKTDDIALIGAGLIFITGLLLYIAPHLQVIRNESLVYLDARAHYASDLTEYETKVSNTRAQIQEAKATYQADKENHFRHLTNYGEKSWRTELAKQRKNSSYHLWSEKTKELESVTKPQPPVISDALRKATQELIVRLGLYFVVFFLAYVMKRTKAKIMY